MRPEYFAQVQGKNNRFTTVGDFHNTPEDAKEELAKRGLLGWIPARVCVMEPMVCSCGRFKGECENYYDPDAAHGPLLS